jgi:hypothetical protein
MNVSKVIEIQYVNNRFEKYVSDYRHINADGRRCVSIYQVINPDIHTDLVLKDFDYQFIERFK